MKISDLKYAHLGIIFSAFILLSACDSGSSNKASNTTSSGEAQENPVEVALNVEGAKVTLPVAAAKEAYSNEFIDAARAAFNNFHWQMGGDHALYYNMHMNEFMPTAMASPSEMYTPLVKDIHPELANLKVKTEGKGELTLEQYLADSLFRTQGFMLIHKGKIVYEAYPGMKPTDRHIWASSAKTTVGLVTAMLAEEGKIDQNSPITLYVPQLEGTVWDEVTVLNVLNHATGFDNEETGASIMNPDSNVVRFFSAALGSPRYATDKVENWLDVARDTKKLPEEKPGEHFRYASINTTVLTQMIENIEGTSWTKVFEDRVWSELMARQPALFNLTPDGTALAVGFLSTTLEDMARYGVLFTPSWKTVANKQVVTPAILDRIYNGGDPNAFKGTTKEQSSIHAINEKASYNSYQFDFIYDDGAMAKGGNQGQFIYVDPKRDFVGVVFSTHPYHSGYGEFKAPAYMRLAAKALAGE